ncbi:MAG: hypothetical protein HMLKMBBP_00920 [Planctomycetes bacterium]|nr:hypothetical protein [Planctomycetota bacterium]
MRTAPLRTSCGGALRSPRFPPRPFQRAAAAALIAFAALATAPSCAGTQGEDGQTLQAYLENAAQYYDGGHYLRAYQQWERALELEPSEEKALLGQAMALYQLGREESKDGVDRLAEAERRLDGLRREGLGDMAWKAELGFAFAQQRWAELYDRKLRKLEADEKAGALAAEGAAQLPVVRAELPKRIARAEASFGKVLEDKRTEPNFHLTCWLGLARAAAMRGDWQGAHDWARKYEKKVTESKAFWKKQGQEYASKLFGAELQEAELRDVLANCLFKLGRDEEAERELDALIALQGTRADAYLNRGVLRHRRRAWDLARSDLRRFLQISPLPKGDPELLRAAELLVECEDELALERKE